MPVAPPALRPLPAVAVSSPSSAPVEVPRVLRRIPAGVKEASDVAALPDGSLLVVGDRSDAMRRVHPDGRIERLELPHVPGGESALEGIAFDPATNSLFVSREESRELLRYRFDPAGREGPVLESRLALDLEGHAKNKGIEGLALLPAALSPTGASELVLCKEGKPRRLYALAADGSGAPREIAFDPRLKDLLGDFSGATIDPKTGHLLIVSDESSALAELSLEVRGGRLEARVVRAPTLRDSNGKKLERIEGVTIDPSGRLFVLLENAAELLELSRG